MSLQLVRRGEEEESEVERIQELFPHDDLRLHERDPITQVSHPSSGVLRYSRQVDISWGRCAGEIVTSIAVGALFFICWQVAWVYFVYARREFWNLLLLLHPWLLVD